MQVQAGFIGLGVMGGAMAEHLLRERGTLHVFNRTKSKAEPVVSAGATFAEIAEIGEVCDLIFLCVSRTEDVLECVEQMATLKPGALVVDHSTIAPQASVRLHGLLKEKGGRFVDAPITGGSMGAKNGQLTIFMGGSEADVAEAIEGAKPYTKRAERVGGPGSGQMAKMVNQIAVAGSLLGLCESLAFAERAGLDLPQIRDMVGGGAGGSWNFVNYGPKILQRDWSPGFTVSNQIKDLDYCHEAAESLGADVPATDLARELLSHLERKGRGDWTTASLFMEYLEPKG